MPKNAGNGPLGMKAPVLPFGLDKLNPTLQPMSFAELLTQVDSMPKVLIQNLRPEGLLSVAKAPFVVIFERWGYDLQEELDLLIEESVLRAGWKLKGWEITLPD